MKSNTKQICLESIRNRVLSMELAPGSLLDETVLATEFGISRTPLREIIQRLCGEGYLVMEPNRGAKVAPMDFATMRHFFQAAPMVYAAISRLASEMATAAQIDALKAIQTNYLGSIKAGRSAETAMYNHAFHHAIGEMAASPYLQPSLERLLIDHTRIGQTFYQSKSLDDQKTISTASAQHDALIEAIENRSAANAVDITLQHWALSRDRMEQFVSPDPLTFNLGEQANAANAV